MADTVSSEDIVEPYSDSTKGIGRISFKPKGRELFDFLRPDDAGKTAAFTAVGAAMVATASSSISLGRSSDRR